MIAGGKRSSAPGKEIVLSSSGQPSTGKLADDDLGLTFYRQTPNVEMSVREFEDMTKERLKLLHIIDRVCGYDAHLSMVADPPLKSKVTSEFGGNHFGLRRPADWKDPGTYSAEKAEFCRKDTTSHYALVLAFCKSREAREWFVRQEQRLFVMRFSELSLPAQDAFFQQSGVPCHKHIPSDQKELEKLQKMTPGARIFSEGGGAPRYDSTFYEMPFHEVHPQLISKRQVIIMNGIAYVPSTSLKLIVASKFKEQLVKTLDVAFQGLESALCDPRVGGFLRLIQDHGMQLLVAKSSTSGEPGEKLSLENFEELMLRSFPPCMRRVVDRQRDTKKHLKHAGRLQLRPFLKECGFTIDESFRWWKQELCRDPEIDATKFEKEYVYDIEHTYGKKGHFQGQNSFGCSKLIGFPGEAAGQVHGCIFRQLEMPALRQQLHRWKISESAAGEIESLVTNGKHYQLACVEYFKATHPGHEGDGVGNSPADFYRESCRCYTKKGEKADTATGEKVSQKG